MIDRKVCLRCAWWMMELFYLEEDMKSKPGTRLTTIAQLRIEWWVAQRKYVLNIQVIGMEETSKADVCNTPWLLRTLTLLFIIICPCIFPASGDCWVYSSISATDRRWSRREPLHRNHQQLHHGRVHAGKVQLCGPGTLKFYYEWWWESVLNLWNIRNLLFTLLHLPCSSCLPHSFFFLSNYITD